MTKTTTTTTKTTRTTRAAAERKARAAAEAGQGPKPSDAPTQAPAKPAAKVVTVEREDGKTARLLAVTAFAAPVAAANNVLARANSLCAAHKEADLKLRAGKPCRVRVPYTLASWEKCEQFLLGAGGVARAGDLSAVATTDFVRYAQRRGWLVAA